MPLRILIDTNVVVAALVPTHPHHGPSAAVLNDERLEIFIAAHALAEAYSTLTRRGTGWAYQFAPERAVTALQSVIDLTRTITMSPAQTLDAIRMFSARGGRGPELYDFLIGQTGLLAGAAAIVTWNMRHFRPLFPDERVETPPECLARLAAH